MILPRGGAYQPVPQQPNASFPQPLNQSAPQPPRQPFSQVQGQPFLQPPNASFSQIPSQPFPQPPIPPKRHTGLIVILSVLALVIAAAGIFLGLKFFGVIGEENNKEEKAEEAVPEKIFHGLELSWKEPAAVPFSAVKPSHIESRLAAEGSSYVLVAGWDDQRLEAVVMDPATRKIVPMAESGVDVSQLDGKITSSGTFLASIPPTVSDVSTIPVHFEPASPDPVRIGESESESEENENATVAKLSTADFDLPDGLIAQPLLIGENPQGEANLIVASQSMDNPQSCKLVDYSADGTAQWVQDLDVSCAQVSASEKGNIYVTHIDIGGVTMSEYAPAAKPASPPAEEDLPSVIPTDYIKQLDFANLPARVSGWNYAYSKTYGDGGITFLKVPESLSGEGDENWYTMQNGESVAYSYVHTFDQWSADLSLLSTVVDGVDVDYQDFDGDGFLDAMVEYGNPSSREDHVYIFDPADPQHPWGAFVHSSQYLPLEYRDGMFRGEVDSCLKLRFKIERDSKGAPVVTGYENVENEGFGACISE